MGRGSESVEEALAAAVQDLARSPVGDCRPDGFAAEFDEAYTAFVGSLDRLPSDSQLLALQALDSALAAMTGPENAELWSGGAFEHHPRWGEIRDIAREVVEQFGWASVA